MPKPHLEQLSRLSFRIDEPTRKRLDRIAKLLASREHVTKPNRTAAVRFVAQIAEIFDDATFENVQRIVAKLSVGPDRSGTVAFAEAIKFAVKVAAEAMSGAPAPKKRGT